jgi:RNA-directed DNA polymerase
LKQEVLINKLDPVIRGWCNYFSTVVSKEIFNQLDSLIWWKLWKWGVKRHPNKGKKWLKSKYFPSETFYDKDLEKLTSRNWIFATTKDGEICRRLLNHADIEINRHVKVKGDASPYNGNLVYWSTRMGKNPEMPLRKAKLLKFQNGLCNQCGLAFQHDDVLEVDHIIPKSKGGKDNYKNLQLLHRHCHDEKTVTDGSYEL